MKPIEAILVGAGSRGYECFGKYALRFPSKLKFIGVVEPNKERRELFVQMHSIKKEYCFSTYEELFEKPQLAECLICATMENLHYPIVKEALIKGYHVLVEKPISSLINECLELYYLAKENRKILFVCTPLRYTPYYGTVNKKIKEGQIGEIRNINYSENISFSHFAHSFVRGKFSNTKIASPMILAKTIHDLDILLWWIGKKWKKVSAFGDLTYFKKSKMPQSDIPERCINSCPIEHNCIYSAIREYLIKKPQEIKGFGSIFFDLYGKGEFDEDKVLKALSENNYGKCVYQCENNQPDQIVSIIEFEDDILVSFILQCFTHLNTRLFSIYGTKGQITSPIYGTIIVHEFFADKHEEIFAGAPEGSHGGGDYNVIHKFLECVKNNATEIANNILKEVIQAHILGFAIEKSRKENKIVYREEFDNEIKFLQN